jgi:hypothetical protein
LRLQRYHYFFNPANLNITFFILFCFLFFPYSSASKLNQVFSKKRGEHIKHSPLIKNNEKNLNSTATNTIARFQFRIKPIFLN